MHTPYDNLKCISGLLSPFPARKCILLCILGVVCESYSISNEKGRDFHVVKTCHAKVAQLKTHGQLSQLEII